METTAGGPKVLVAEADDGQRRELVDSLSKEGHRVTAAAGWRDALKRAEAEPPDIAVIDAPEESFSSICRHPALEGIPVVALSGEYCDRAIASEAGCALCVPKPVNAQNVAFHVAEILSQRSSPESPVL